MRRIDIFLQAVLCFALAASCSDDTPNDNGTDQTVELSEEWYSGGKLGTVFNATTYAYEQPAPAVENAGMIQAFKHGEQQFERDFNENGEGAFSGLGPLMVRRGCLYCHPNYGHGKRQEQYRANTMGNGYLLVITDDTDTYLSSLTGMPQTLAVAPFKAPLDETKIKIEWKEYTDEWGNKFPDGETYSLIYPEVSIPEDAYYVPLEVTKNGVTEVVPHSKVRVRLESTIGIYGTGLLDAIDDDDLKAQYAAEEAAGVPLNPAIFANGNWVKTYSNTGHPLRYTYALSRGPLQDAAGANAIWNITNVTRSDRRYHYMTATYAKTASKDADVQAEFYKYFPSRKTDKGVEADIYDYLMSKDLDVEMSDENYINFMVWHRGLAVPAARDMDDADVQRGKQLFTEIGCAYCHRPSWTTGDDKFSDPNGFFAEADARLPRYPHQKIWPYTDMVQHRLFMKNDIRTGWCRTTPLWGRGLSEMINGGVDRLHDCRARTVIESIMWHGSQQSDARRSTEKFRMLSKSDRNAIVKFINAI
ncbi:MAG: di-heme oxidoredictase family protein [Muribaculaceae bacterium]